jgi:hypothetical protein
VNETTKSTATTASGERSRKLEQTRIDVNPLRDFHYRLQHGIALGGAVMAYNNNEGKILLEDIRSPSRLM